MIHMLRVGAALLALADIGVAAAAEPDGAAIYTRCAACHLPDARGVPGAFPPLGAQVAAFARDEPGRTYLIMVVATGLTGRLQIADRTYQGVMPSQGTLGDADIAAVLTHVLRTFAKAGSEVRDFDRSEVEKVRAQHPQADAAAVYHMRPAAASRPASTAMLGVDNPQRAQQSWILNCRGCHGAAAQGFSASTPPIAGTVAGFLSVTGGRDYLVRVPGVATAPLPDSEVAELLNWMLWTYDARNIPSDFVPFSPSEVRRLRRNPLRTEAGRIRAQLLALKSS
jgi:mono/diheme cytochrome c family protein